MAEVLLDSLPAVLVDLITGLAAEQLILVAHTPCSLVLYYFNLHTLVWEDEKEIVLPSQDADRVAHNHNVFLVQDDQIHQYDLSDGVITTYPSLQETLKLVIVNGTVYAIEPLNYAIPRYSRGNTMVKLTVDGTWVRTPDVPHSYDLVTIATTDRYIYVAGTLYYPNTSISQYDTLTDTWSSRTQRLFGCGISFIFTVKTTLYCILHSDNGMVVYMVRDGEWDEVTTLPPQFGLNIKSVVNIGSTIYYLNMDNKMLMWDMKVQAWSELILTPVKEFQWGELTKW